MSRRGRSLKMLLAASALGVLGCTGSTPRDIHYGTDAEANFEAPVFEAKPSDVAEAGVADEAGDASDAATAGTGGAGTTGAGGMAGNAGTGGAAGSDAAVGDAGQ